jgi:hypothetical protein
VKRSRQRPQRGDKSKRSLAQRVLYTNAAASEPRTPVSGFRPVRSRRIRRRALQLFPIIFLTCVLGNWNDTSTGLDLNRLHPFPLSKIRSGWLKAGTQTVFDGITASAVNRNVPEVLLRGTGKSGKPWEATLFGVDEVWRGDLDGNGTQDYVFFSGGPRSNGRTAPPYSLSILLMDSAGLPVPFFTAVFHGANGDGIKHLVDLNHDNHAELLISSYDEIPSDSRVGAFCSGHWVNQLYRFKDLGVEEIRNTVGDISFPFVHDWTYHAKDCVDEAKPYPLVAQAEIYNHGTVAGPEARTKIREARDPASIAIEPVAGCDKVTPTVIAYDQLGLREISFPAPFVIYNIDLAGRILKNRATVELRGIQRSGAKGDCNVNLLWAK